MENLQVQVDRNKRLGSGAYSKVFQGRWQGIEVAVKRIQLLDFLTDREEATMQNVDHPNVLKLFAVEEDADFKYLVLELCCATIEDYCQGIYRGNMPPDVKALFQMADGLDYIHSQNLVHRDISTGNVLIKSNDDNNEVVLKISDFGFCKPASETGSFSMSQGLTGTKRFIAPELLMAIGIREDDPNKPRGKISSDIFSLGCLFFTFLTRGHHPFSNGGSIHHIPIHILSNTYSLDRLEERHNYARTLIEEMIRSDPDQRLELRQVKFRLTQNELFN